MWSCHSTVSDGCLQKKTNTFQNPTLEINKDKTMTALKLWAFKLLF